jgi:hypothetical protein
MKLRQFKESKAVASRVLPVMPSETAIKEVISTTGYDACSRSVSNRRRLANTTLGDATRSLLPGRGTLSASLTLVILLAKAVNHLSLQLLIFLTPSFYYPSSRFLTL